MKTSAMNRQSDGGAGSMAISLWCARMERALTDREESAMMLLLPSERRARLERVRKAEKRQEVLCAYTILQLALREECGWRSIPRIELSSMGKPGFAEHPDVHFNLSHTTGAVLIGLSDEPIGSPLVTNPNVLVAMNRPSLDKFIGDVEPGGVVILDSSLIDVKVEREDVSVHYVPASALAEENGLKGLANIILVGKLFKEVGFCSAETLDKAIQKCVPARKAAMLDFNRKAVEIGSQQ